MSDNALRELERRFRETGSPNDQERYRRELFRSGRLAHQLDVVLTDARRRRAGHVQAVLIQATLPLPGLLDALAEAAYYPRGLGHEWVELEPQRAQEVAAALLHRDMAYRAQVLPRREAERIAAEFFDLFAPPLRCFSNSDWEPDLLGGPLQVAGWNPISSATFDSGVLVVDAVAAGLLWFEDED